MQRFLRKWSADYAEQKAVAVAVAVAVAGTQATYERGLPLRSAVSLWLTGRINEESLEALPPKS